jgi:hypothetical protein
MASVSSLFRNLTADGHLSKGDLRTLAVAMNDGRGITTGERDQLKASMQRARTEGVAMSEPVQAGYEAFLRRTQRYDSTHRTQGAPMSDSEIRSFIDVHAQGLRRTSGGEYSPTPRRTSGGEYATRTTPRRTSGGEYSTTVRRTSGGEATSTVRRTSGGEASTTVRTAPAPAPRRTSGGE